MHMAVMIFCLCDRVKRQPSQRWQIGSGSLGASLVGATACASEKGLGNELAERVALAWG